MNVLSSKQTHTQKKEENTETNKSKELVAEKKNI